MATTSHSSSAHGAAELRRVRETVKTVEESQRASYTQLKLGVNEKPHVPEGLRGCMETAERIGSSTGAQPEGAECQQLGDQPRGHWVFGALLFLVLGPVILLVFCFARAIFWPAYSLYDRIRGKLKHGGAA